MALAQATPIRGEYEPSSSTFDEWFRLLQVDRYQPIADVLKPWSVHYYRDDHLSGRDARASSSTLRISARIAPNALLLPQILAIKGYGMLKSYVFGVFGLVLGSSAVAQTTYCDDYGNCSGGGVNTYTDDYGNTSGVVGGQRYNTYTDDYGNTSGSIGGGRVNTYTDDYGNTSGTIGDDRVNLYTDDYGNTSGTIGGERVNCYTDDYGNTSCN